MAVTWEFRNLPFSREGSPGKECSPQIYALHIHEGGACDGGGAEPFASAGGHYDTTGCGHPGHTGDLPPVFGNNGYAWGGVYTEKFSVEEVVGKTVILHRQKDDFSTQPAGNAGMRIGCGVIRRQG